MKKTIITVVGKDTVGIIAKVCTYLAENGINILDISQTIVSDFFNMMMIVDTNSSKKAFGDMVDDLEKIRPFEPNVVKAAWNIFGKSYEYRKQYIEYKAERMKAERRAAENPDQITLDELLT